MRPRGAVEALGDAADGGAGPVAHDSRGDGAAGAHELPQRLHGVEEAVLPGAGQGDAVPGDQEFVTPGGEGMAVAGPGRLGPGAHGQGPWPCLGGVGDPAGPGLPQHLAQRLDGVPVGSGVGDQGDLVRHRHRGAVPAQGLRSRPDGKPRPGGVGRGCRGGVRGGRGSHRGGRDAEASGDEGDRESRCPLPTPQSHRPPPDVFDRENEPTTRPVRVSTRVAIVTELPEPGRSGGTRNVTRSTMFCLGRLTSRRLGRAATTRRTTNQTRRPPWLR